MATVRFNGVSKVYPDGTRAVTDLELAIRDAEFMVLVGPSGSGKTTALRMVAGLEEITSGTIEIGARVVNEVPPRDRDIAMVFQNYALYPHMTAFDNIGFGLRLRRRKRGEIRDKVTSASRLLGLDEMLEKKPRELSGGQRQRVAMGRAIVRQPQVFLMDEPLSNLDAQLRVQMRAEIRHLQRDLGVTTLYVTHDQVEAMTLGDRVAVFRDGRLQQVAAPADLYARPANVFVATFIGSPAMNMLRGTVRAAHAGLTIELAGTRLAVPNEELASRGRLERFAGRELVVGIRPEALYPSISATAVNGGGIRARVELVELLGAEALVHASVPGRAVTRSARAELAGDEERTLVVARLDAAAAPNLGDEIKLAVDVGRLHFFDAESGETVARQEP